MVSKDNNVFTYTPENNKKRIKASLKNGSIWLDKASIKELFESATSDFNDQIQAVYPAITSQDFTALRENNNHKTPRSLYPLDIITALGYLSQHPEAPRFRRWAYRQIVQNTTAEKPTTPFLGWGYFDELKNRKSIAENTAMEFWYKTLDLYALCEDYLPEKAAFFYKKISENIFWGVFKNTPEEFIFNRIDAEKPHLGLLHFSGNHPNKKEALSVRNYLKKNELKIVNELTRTFLNMAKPQAQKGKSTKSNDWISRLEATLQMTGHTILLNEGKVSSEEVCEKVKTEFSKL